MKIFSFLTLSVGALNVQGAEHAAVLESHGVGALRVSNGLKRDLKTAPHISYQVLEGPLMDDSAYRFNVSWGDLGYPGPVAFVGAFGCFKGESNEECTTNRYPVQSFNTPWGVTENGGESHATFTVQVRPGVEAYRFAYVSSSGGGSSAYPETLCISTPFTIPKQVQELARHVRLSVVEGSPSSMRFMWAVSPVEYNKIKKNQHKVVVRDTKTGHKVAQASARSIYSYDRESMCGRDTELASNEGFATPGTQLEAIVHHLEASTTYSYEILHKKKVIAGPFNFTSNPALSPESPSTFVVFGDMGVSMNWLDGSMNHAWDGDGKGELAAPATAKLVEKLVDQYPVSLVNHIGDISYAVGDEYIWDEFLYQVQNITRKVPYQTAIGNHESDTWLEGKNVPYNHEYPNVEGNDSGGECGVSYATYFPFSVQRDSLKKKRGNMVQGPVEGAWYSYNHGAVHFTVMSTEHNMTIGSPQYEWIKNDLESVDRARTPWSVFIGHRPMYISSKYSGDHDIMQFTLQRDIAPLLYANNVSVAFYGHHHSMQRTKPIDGTVHIVTGAGGFDNSPSNGTFGVFEFVEDQEHGVSLVEVLNKTHMRHRFFSSDSGEVIDETMIENVWK